jgi:protein TonB
MICQKCNKTIEDAALFCGFCGTPFKPIGQKEVAEPILPTDIVVGKSNEEKLIDQPAPKIQESKNNTRLWKIISAALAIIIIALIAFEKYKTGLQLDHQKSDTTGIVQNKGQQGEIDGSSPHSSNQTLLENSIQPHEKEAEISPKDQPPDYSVQSGRTENTQNTSLDEDFELKNEDEFSVSSIEKDASSKNQQLTDEKIFTFIPNMPSFPGGNEALVKYIQNNLKYPQIAKESGIQGIVYTSFVVETDGQLSAIKILKGIGGGCDEEAIRLIRAMPNWVPGKKENKTVRVQNNMPMKFSF